MCVDMSVGSVATLLSKRSADDTRGEFEESIAGW